MASNLQLELWCIPWSSSSITVRNNQNNGASSSNHGAAMNTQMDPFQNQNRPYYLHLRENPTMVLVSTPLNGSNYHSCACVMWRAISSKNKIRFVDESILIPIALTLILILWESNNNLVHSWLMNSISSSIEQSSVYGFSGRRVERPQREVLTRGSCLYSRITTRTL